MIHDLLYRVHEMTGGLGVTIQTITTDGLFGDYTVTVTWRKNYHDTGSGHPLAGHLCYSEKREASGKTMEEALENVLKENAK